MKFRIKVAIMAICVICFLSVYIETITILTNMYLGKTLERKDYNNGIQDLFVDSMIGWLNDQAEIQPSFWTLNYNETRDLVRYNLTGVRHLDANQAIRSMAGKMPHWSDFMANINEVYLYDWRNVNIDALRHDMATMNITQAEQMKSGSELKLDFVFHKLFRAVAKPMRFGREVQTNPNHFVIDQFERHVAEIAAFHLDRLLGFNRVPPTIGRRVNLTEFKTIVTHPIRNNFFKSPVGNTCFFGDCNEHCGPKYAFCGQDDMMEFSLMVYVQEVLNGKFSARYLDNPYNMQKSSRFMKADWELDPNYCAIVRKHEFYRAPAALVNLVDTHIFDYLAGNRDRHTMVYFADFSNSSSPLLFDNGRGFGTSDRDYPAILTPLRQCCQIKKSTLLKLIKLYMGPEKLSNLMAESLKSDPIAPVVLPAHLMALDRRLVEVLRTVAECLNHRNRTYKEVVFADV